MFKISVGDKLMGIQGENRSTGEKKPLPVAFRLQHIAWRDWKRPRVSAMRNRRLFDPCPCVADRSTADLQSYH